MADKGRPTTITLEVIDRICERIMQGESLNKICKDDDMPSAVTFFSWLKKAEDGVDEFDLLNKYTRARECQADYYADEIKEVSELPVENAVQLGQLRLRVEALKWTASKLKPKKYGDKTEVDHKSSDGTMQPQVIQLVGKDGNSQD